jgi:branched-chain amino acid transport system ATP-binding protein
LIAKQGSELISEIAQCGLAILLVEQRLSIALSISNRAYMIDQVRIAFEGAQAELKSNDAERRE